MSNIQKAIKIGAICFAIFIIVSIVNGILFGINLFVGWDKDYDKIEFSQNYQNIQKIDFDVSSAEITVKSGTRFMVEATNVSDAFSSTEKNGTLYIKEKNHFWGRKTSGKIIVTIPTNSNVEELKISSGAGKIEINDVTINKAMISQGAGLLKITNAIFIETDIDGGAGEMNISSSVLQNLDLDAGVGKVFIDGEIFGVSKIDCGVGELKLKLGNKEKYNLKLEKGIGTIQIDGIEYKNTELGSGQNKIDIEGGIGSIQIEFKE